MKTVLFTLALLAQMTVQAAVSDRFVSAAASADTSNDVPIVAKAAKENGSPGHQQNRRSSTKR
ncbi:hypothetical protein [Hydrogenophaga sp.]|uniref:hypothetical protein n=1 Tax=Hydrogenophaga sp. TaxID=1904254 RepID=UPI0035B14B54